MIYSQAGHLSLQIPKLWLHCHVGTEQEAAQHIPVGRRDMGMYWVVFSRAELTVQCDSTTWGDSRLVALQPPLSLRAETTVALVCALRIQLLVTEPVG